MVEIAETSLKSFVGFRFSGIAEAEREDGSRGCIVAEMRIGEAGVGLETREGDAKPKAGDYIVCSKFRGAKIGSPEFEMLGLRREGRKSEKAECFLKIYADKLCLIIIGRDKTEYEIEMEGEKV